MNKKHILSLIPSLGLMLSGASYGLTFSMEPMPGTTLPTEVGPGGTVTAVYLVKLVWETEVH